MDREEITMTKRQAAQALIDQAEMRACVRAEQDHPGDTVYARMNRINATINYWRSEMIDVLAETMK